MTSDAAKPNIFAILRAETDFMEWEVCDDCNGIGSDENAHFWCHVCNGEGGRWTNFDPRVTALIDLAEQAMGEHEGCPIDHCTIGAEVKQLMEAIHVE